MAKPQGPTPNAMTTRRLFTSRSCVHSTAYERPVPYLPCLVGPIAFRELDACEDLRQPKPIVNKPRSKFRTSQTMRQRAAKRVVGCDTDSVVEPIRDVA